jgi:hypothetical protein
MSQAADKAIERWVDRMTGKTDRDFLKSGNILCRDDAVYSYGSHFEMARPLRDKKGAIHTFLLNGDTYSNTTTGHQSTVRGALSRTGIQMVIIPHEALHGAGIDLDSIQIVDVSRDRHETINHHFTERQEGWVVKREKITGYRDLTPEELQAKADKKTADALQSYNLRLGWAEKEGPDSYWAKHPEPRPEPFKVENLDSYDTRKWDTLGTRDVLYTSARRGAPEIDIDVDERDGTTHYRWTTYRHWLGESLIRAKVQWSRWETCRWCEGGGWGIGPAIWHGDQSVRCFPCRGRGGAAKLHHRWAYFLSGFDHQEARPLYFLCELPRGAKPATVAEAYEALKPEPVKMAEQMNRAVERQGDIFAVATTLDRKVLKARGARIVRRNMNINSPADRPIELPYILNTNHTASEVAYLPDGVTLARGTMYHDPADRPQDHARHRLGDGKTWHIVIKNTVPTTVRR